MGKARNKWIMMVILLVLSTLACTSIYRFASSEEQCETIGGTWIPAWDGWDMGEEECIKPLSGSVSSAGENNEGDKENPIKPAEESESDLVYEIPIEACVAKPDEYAWEFANVNNEASNETKEVCQGDFFVWNTSNRVLNIKLFEHWDNGAMQDIGWSDRFQPVEPGESFSDYFGTQTYSTGDVPETVDTYKELIVFYALPDCAEFLINEENEGLWEDYAVPLSDPCR